MYLGLPDIVFYIVNFLVVVTAMRFLVYKPVVNFMKKRESDIEKMLDDARVEREKADKAFEEHEKSIEQARRETALILAEASKSAAARADSIIAQASVEASELRKRAERDIENEKQHALRAMRSELADMALAIAQKIIKREISAEDNHRLIDDFFEEVG